MEALKKELKFSQSQQNKLYKAVTTSKINVGEFISANNWLEVGEECFIYNNLAYNKDGFVMYVNDTNCGNIKEITPTVEHLHILGQKTRVVQLGSDPEIFVKNELGKIIPAFKFLPPKVEEGGKINTVYWDGFQAEFTHDPCTCIAIFTAKIKQRLNGLLMVARKHNPLATLSNKTLISVSKKTRDLLEKKYVEFGCTPSLNAYGMEGSIANGRDCKFRPAGGHIHFGLKSSMIQNFKDMIPLCVKNLDLVSGIIGVSMFESVDRPERRTMYGLAGEYRTPEYGFEYRVLSNAWLFHPLLLNITLEIARAVVNISMSGVNLYDLVTPETTEALIVSTINTCDAKTARQIITNNKPIFDKILTSISRNEKVTQERTDVLFTVISQDISKTIVDPSNISKNWVLTGEANMESNANNYIYTTWKNIQKNKVVA
jgi:hypothetical protein